MYQEIYRCSETTIAKKKAMTNSKTAATITCFKFQILYQIENDAWKQSLNVEQRNQPRQDKVVLLLVGRKLRQRQPNRPVRKVTKPYYPRIWI
jgi:hypothetical protein